MAKTVKIPLVMANGEKATDMKSLIHNFDISSIVGYFLDGKLEKWLCDRYYEDIAQEISHLDKDDPALVSKLCEIFGVNYDVTSDIDTDEIIRRNERIARLKQITDDMDILENSDNVAFNQNELDALYEKGVEKIILCEGEFQIPESHQALEYTIIANASVIGLTDNAWESDVQDFEDCTTFNNIFTSTSIPEDMAEKLKWHDYVSLNDYIVFFKYEEFQHFTRLSKRINLIQPSSASGIRLTSNKQDELIVWDKQKQQEYQMREGQSTHFDDMCRIKASNNRLLISKTSSDGIVVYDMDSQKKNAKICTDIASDSDISTFGNTIVYADNNHNLVVYDMETSQSTKHYVYVPGKFHYRFAVSANKLFYITNKSFLVYNFAENKREELFNIQGKTIDQIAYHDGKVYLFVSGDTDSQNEVWIVDEPTPYTYSVKTADCIEGNYIYFHDGTREIRIHQQHKHLFNITAIE